MGYYGIESLGVSYNKNNKKKNLLETKLYPYILPCVDNKVT